MLWEAVQRLSPTRRTVTVLFYYRQQSVREVAAHLGISTGAVKVHLHSARKQLRQQLVPFVTTEDLLYKPEGESTMVTVTIGDVVEQERDDVVHGVVVLVDTVGQRALPIWIGQREAEALARALRDMAFPRPQALDLLSALLRELDAMLEVVQISALRENTYYATLHIRRGKETRTVDARPSDALALAALQRCSVTIEESFLAGHALPLAPAQMVQLGSGVDRIIRRLQADLEAMQVHITSITPEETQRIHQDLTDLLVGQAET